MPSARKPHNENAGYVCELKCRLGGHVVIYRAAEAGVDSDASDPWVVMHEPSSYHIAARSLRHARSLMKDLAQASDLGEVADAGFDGAYGEYVR